MFVENTIQKKNTAFPVYILVIFALAISAMVCFYMLFFVMRGNFREVLSGRVYRSAQPSPKQLREWIEYYDIKTIINLRGHNGKTLREQEMQIAREFGVTYVEFNLKANDPMPSDLLRDLIKQIEKARTPLLLHCRHGVDRAGTASALAAMALGNEDFEKAKWQAYVPPWPWKRLGKTDYFHISDILTTYENYCKDNGLSTKGWQQLKNWANNLK